MTAKHLSGYSGTLNTVLNADDLVIGVNSAPELLNRLKNDGDWTTLLVKDNTGFEVIKVRNFQGNLAIERGLDGTTSRKFPIGSCVFAEMSETLVKAIVCETSCCDEVDDTLGEVSQDEPKAIDLEVLPKSIIGGVTAVMGEPLGFVLINGMEVPYYKRGVKNEVS